MNELYNQELEWIAQQQIPWNRLENCRVLITGASGMIGKCFIDLLMMKNQVSGSSLHITALSRNEAAARERLKDYWNSKDFTYVSCDVNEKLPEMGDIDYIIHAASNTHPQLYATDPIGTIITNVIGTKNLLDYAVSHNTKQFCFLSSVEIYGENRGDIEKFHETYLGYLDCNTLRAGYPESKRTGEALCNAYHEKYGLSFTIPRLSRVYGPTMLDSDSKAIAQFIKKAAKKEDIVLKSEGKQLYSYTFVTDAVNAILHIILLGECGAAYNIADVQSDISLSNLAELLAEQAGSSVVFELPEETEKKGYSTATKAMLDASKIEKLGWQARVPIQRGMKISIHRR